MTMATKMRTALLGIAGALTLGGCVYDGYGSVGLATGYDGYYGDGYYGDYYAGGYYGSGYYGGYGYPAYGWYNGFYYPGSGYYIYDRGGARHRWRDSDRRYWEGRRQEASRRGWRDGDRNGRDDRVIRDREDRADGRGFRNDGRRDPRVVQQRDQRADRATTRGFRDNGAARSVQRAPRADSARSYSGPRSSSGRSSGASARGWRGDR